MLSTTMFCKLCQRFFGKIAITNIGNTNITTVEVAYGKVFKAHNSHLEQTQKQVSFSFWPTSDRKSSLIANQFQDDVKLSQSLLNSRVRRRCQADPGVLRDEIETRGISDGLVIIDEIQKIPELLDEVHLLIEETNIRFLLTSSSARRLKEQEVNLLGGRAGKMNLHPFVWPEIKEFNPTLDRILKYGRLSNSEHFFFRNYVEFRKKYLSVLNKILF